MKKFITLLLSMGIFTVSFAQGNYHKNWGDQDDQYARASNGRYDNDGHHYDHNRNYSYQNQSAFEIQKINQDYNYQVMSIENNPYMRNHQRRVALRNAERERDHRIQQVNARYARMDRSWERR